MQVTKEMLKSYEMQLKAEVGKEEIAEKYKEKYDYLQKNVEIKGFRKGKAPLALIKLKLDENFVTEFSNELAEEYINNYVKENNIEKLSKFELKEFDLAEDKPFTFTAVFQVMPEISVSEDMYKGIKIVKKDNSPTEDEINQMLEGYRSQKAVLKPFEGPVDEDTILYGDLNIESIDNPENTMEKADFSIAKGTYIIGESIFDDLIGMNRDDVFEKKLSFGSDFYSFEKSEMLKVRYAIRSLKKQELPPLNDDLAKQIDENLNSLEDLKKKISKDIENRKKDFNRQKSIGEIDNHLISSVDIEAPPVLVDFELYKLINHYQAQMARYNIGFRSDEEKKQFIENRKVDAEKNAKLNIIIDAIIKKEAIDAQFDEVKNKINEMVKDEENASELRKEYLKDESFNNIKESLKIEKLYDYLIENAILTKEESQTEKPAEDPSKELKE